LIQPPLEDRLHRFEPLSGSLQFRHASFNILQLDGFGRMIEDAKTIQMLPVISRRLYLQMLAAQF
jgi:hypothetical protein